MVGTVVTIVVVVVDVCAGVLLVDGGAVRRVVVPGTLDLVRVKRTIAKVVVVVVAVVDFVVDFVVDDSVDEPPMQSSAPPEQASGLVLV